MEYHTAIKINESAHPLLPNYVHNYALAGFSISGVFPFLYNWKIFKNLIMPLPYLKILQCVFKKSFIEV